MKVNPTLYGQLYNKLCDEGYIQPLVEGFPNFGAVESIKEFFVDLVQAGRLDSYYVDPPKNEANGETPGNPAPKDGPG